MCPIGHCIRQTLCAKVILQRRQLEPGGTFRLDLDHSAHDHEFEQEESKGPPSDRLIPVRVGLEGGPGGIAQAGQPSHLNQETVPLKGIECPADLCDEIVTYSHGEVYQSMLYYTTGGET